jgi:hypothetical protein
MSMASLAADIEPPQKQVVDKFGVNMANGQITHSLQTVSIGGAMWNSPDLPDTEIRCDDDLGGIGWEGGRLLGSSSLRRSSWSPSEG